MWSNQALTNTSSHVSRDSVNLALQKKKIIENIVNCQNKELKKFAAKIICDIKIVAAISGTSHAEAGQLTLINSLIGLA